VFTLFKTLSYNLTLISSLFADGIHSDDSFEGHKALMAKIKAHVERNVTYDNKAEYSALVDTLKKLAENDI
jgi:hypothetical protein